MSRLLLKSIAIWVFLALIISAQMGHAADKNDSDVPYGNALDEIRKQNFKEALSWLETILTDFPNTEKSYRARVLLATIYTSRELACLKIVNLFAESKKLIYGKKRKKTAMQFDKTIAVYKKKSINAANILTQITREIVRQGGQEKLKDLMFNVVIDPKGWEVEPLRKYVKKGKMPEKKDLQKLYHGELLTAFMGFMSEIVPPQGGNILSGIFRGNVDRIKFFRAIGDRLLINSRRIDADESFAQMSRACFEKVKNLTKENLYSKERKRAREGLSELDKKDSVKSLIRCPKCKKVMKSDWKFCPYDGTAIEK